MDDRALVALMIRRDPAGLDGVYRRYADPLYTYCVATLHDRDAAADVVHDTFLIAVRRIHQLRDPERLRPWLYAVARRECLRVLRRASRDVPLSAAPEPCGDDPAGDVVVAAHAREVAELVGAAVDGLSGADREVIHLSLRHGLSGTGLATALGVSVNHAKARLSRARSGLLQALGALTLARASACPEVTALTTGWAGRLDPLLRKRISRHARDCESCAAELRRRLHPVALLSAYAALPLLAVPATIWARILASPGPPAAQGARGRWWAAAAALVALAVAATLLARSPTATAPAATNAAPTSVAPVPDTVRLEAQPTSASPTRPSSPGRSASADPSRSRAPSSSRPPDRTGFAVTARAAAACTGSVGFRLSVTATGTAPLRTALLYWRAPDLDRVAMTRDGSSATADVPRLRAPVTWWVEAVAVDGRRFATAPVTTADPC